MRHLANFCRVKLVCLSAGGLPLQIEEGFDVCFPALPTFLHCWFYCSASLLLGAALDHHHQGPTPQCSMPSASFPRSSHGVSAEATLCNLWKSMWLHWFMLSGDVASPLCLASFWIIVILGILDTHEQQEAVCCSWLHFKGACTVHVPLLLECQSDLHYLIQKKKKSFLLHLRDECSRSHACSYLLETEEGNKY